MLVKLFASAVHGIDAQTVTIEVNMHGGTKTIIVGLPDNAVQESKLRVKTSLRHNQLKLPNMAYLINMAPADIKKEGAAYDLPIAIGMLASAQMIGGEGLSEHVVMGELGLDGSLLPIKGVLPMAINAMKDGFSKLVLPLANAREAAIVKDLDVYGFDNIKGVVDYFRGESDVKPTFVDPRAEFEEDIRQTHSDFQDVRGQEKIKRAMEVAAAGGHNLILIGPPGAGKTMLAKRLPGILPPLDLKEALETTKIHSVAGKLGKQGGLVAHRPFRNPHHTISDVALVGGGNNPQPGEISLAHNGVLFLDELPEFKRNVLEVLRQPLEERKVTVSRARFSVDYPASFMMMASMNPCPCGYFNHPEKDCVCAPGIVQKYMNKISGPLLDRIDLHVEVTPVEFDELTGERQGDSTTVIRERVKQARAIQSERFKEQSQVFCNAQMDTALIQEHSVLDQAGNLLLKAAMKKLNLSARAYDRILKVARTVADVEGSEKIEIAHLAEAIQYRSLDRESWGV